MKLPNVTRPLLSSRWAQDKNYLFLFLNLDTVLSDSTQKILPTFDKCWQKKIEKIKEDRWSLTDSANPLFKWRFDFLSSRNFATMATWRNDFLLSIFKKLKSVLASIDIKK